jgi:hypothetical protein
MIYEELARKYLARSEKQSKCTAFILEQTAHYEETGQGAAETIFAASLHINMLSHDVMALMLLHSLTDDKWANRTAARMAATLIYEGADDLQVIFGKPFREACGELGVLKDVEADLARLKKELALFQEKHNPVLKPIRMAAGAHRDHDIKAFLGAFIDESVTTAVVDAAGGLEECLRNWGGFCTIVMDRVREVLGGSNPTK